MKFVKLSIVALTLGVFVTSCGGGEGTKPNADSAANAATAAPAAPTTPTAAPAPVDTMKAGPAKDTAAKK